MTDTAMGLVGNPLLELWASLGKEWDASVHWYEFFKCTWDQVFAATERLNCEHTTEEIRQLHEHMIQNPWPTNLGDGSHIALHSLRRGAVTKYAWAIPTEEALSAIAKYGPIVEIGAGRGYWAALLASRGVDIICYDENPPVEEGSNHWHSTAGLYYPVLEGGPVNVVQHPDRALFLCWPPYRPHKNMLMVTPSDPENWERKDHTYEERDGTTKTYSTWYQLNTEPDPSFEALTHYEAAGGQTLIYVGEGSGGCTGSPTFHARIGHGCDHWGDEKPCQCPIAGWEEVEEVGLPQWEGIHDVLWVFKRKVPELMPAQEEAASEETASGG